MLCQLLSWELPSVVQEQQRYLLRLRLQHAQVQQAQAQAQQQQQQAMAAQAGTSGLAQLGNWPMLQVVNGKQAGNQQQHQQLVPIPAPAKNSKAKQGERGGVSFPLRHPSLPPHCPGL